MTDSSTTGPAFEMEAQLVTASGVLSMFGKGRSTGIVRLTPEGLTFINKKGEVVLTQAYSGVSELDFKKLTGCVHITGDSTFKIYPPMASTGNDIGDVVGVATGVASTYTLYETLRDLVEASPS